MFDYNIGVAHNWGLGSQYTNVDGTTDRYSYLTPGNRTTRDDFNILRLGGSYLRALPTDWQLRLAANGQYSGDPLVVVEQLGLAGSTAVRGFNERAVSADSGYVVNAEVYTPELIKAGSDLRGSLRALAFYDVGRGYNQNIPTGSLTPAHVSIASVGAGLRYALGKDFSLRFDLAQVVDGGPAGTQQHGDWRGHVNLMLAF
jgi:hemolysin activation/secretion protein